MTTITEVLLQQMIDEKDDIIDRQQKQMEAMQHRINKLQQQNGMYKKRLSAFTRAKENGNTSRSDSAGGDHEQ